MTVCTHLGSEVRRSQAVAGFSGGAVLMSPHIQGVGVMHSENMGPLVCVRVFVQEICGRNTASLFQQSPLSLGQ